MPRHLPIALLLGILTLPLAAQDAPAPPVPQPAPDAKSPKPAGRITGTVLCADTHRPARGAVLMVQALPAADGTTTNPGSGNGMAHVAMDGTYNVERLAPGEYVIVATLPGYLSPLDDMIAGELQDASPQARRQQLARLNAVTITGGETETYDIALERGAAVSGHVLYSDGSPATQVTIDVEDINRKKLTGDNQRQALMASTMFRSMFTHQTESTDDQGHFRVSGLKPGTYRVAAVSSVTMDDGGNEGFTLLLGGMGDPGALRVYSGDTLHAKAAKKYELRSGDEVPGIDITIPLNAYHLVKGTLTAIDGRPLNKATLTLSDTTDDSVSFETSLSEDGAFSFPTVAAGTYTLSAKEARILVRQPGANADIPLRYSPTKTLNVFADGTTTVIVKDTDVPDITLTLTEVPVPPEPNPPPAGL